MMGILDRVAHLNLFNQELEGIIKANQRLYILEEMVFGRGDIDTAKRIRAARSAIHNALEIIMPSEADE